MSITSNFVSTASMGKEEPEVTKEKGLHMIEKALERTDLPGEVSHLGNAILEVAADRLELSDGLLGISALAVAINLKTKADVEGLQFARSPKEEVSRLFG